MQVIYQCFRKAGLISVLFLFTASIVQAQTYTLSGRVTDGITGEFVTGATVMLEGTRYYAVTGLDGGYRIDKVPQGTYIMKVQFISFDTYEEELTIDRNAIVNVALATSQFDLEEFEVVGRVDNGTESRARTTEKQVMNPINIISASEISVSPDITVANVIQRVSGVSLERNSNGDGQYAIVRGMDKRYNYTLVNGVKIPSPDPRNRYVPLDIFPSDLVDQLIVSKALTPNMEGDAIGGVIDMRMKNAPDRFTVNVNVGTGYNQMFINEPFRAFDRSVTARNSPRVANGADYVASMNDWQLNNIDFYDRQAPLNQIYGLSIGDRFLNNKLGVLVAGSYQNTFRGANSLFMTTFVDQETNSPYYEIIQVRKFSTEQERAGVHAKLDYEINRNHSIDLYLAGISLNDFETRTRRDTILKIGRGQGPGTGRIELRERSRQRYQRIYNGTLQGNHRLGKNVRADWSAVYSLATNDDPDMAELQWMTGAAYNQQGDLVIDPIMYDTDYTRRWMNNSDQDLAGYANITWTPTILGLPIDFSTGGMYRHKNRESFFDEYRLRTMPIMQEWSGSVYDASWTLFNTIGTPTHPLNYNCVENVGALYAMFKFDVGWLEVLGGARFEDTYFEWESSAPATVSGRTGNISYMDVLPSAHFKFKPSEKENIRLSYFSSISRPSFFEVIPYEINEEDFRERGNPFLNRTSAQNFDARYERFTNLLDKIMIGVFYKHIDDPIETALAIQGQNVFLQPNNFGTARNMGVEIDFTKYVRNFGIRMFYTYTNSEITTSKIVRFRDDQGNLTSRQENQSRPLQGQSDHISNVSLLYKSVKNGTDVQLSMVYTGKRIISVSPYLDNDIWQRAFVQLDLSIEQRVFKNFVVYAKVNNLLDTPMRADILLPNTFNPEQAPYLDASESVMVMEDFYRQMYLVGIKYNFVKN